jgi:hypothetical protein
MAVAHGSGSCGLDGSLVRICHFGRNKDFDI